MMTYGLYKMLLICEIKKIKQKLLEKSSLKEKVFFGYLSGKPMKFQSGYNLTDIQRICFSMFGLNAPIEKDLINRKRRSKVTGRMHYTHTLIDLAAMAKDNLEQERKNLLSYCQNHTTRDFYILNYLFPNISRDPPIPQGDIDQIALHLYEDDFPPEGWKSLLFGALQETSDLHDLYVIEQGFQQAMDDNPLLHRVQEIEYVTDVLDHVVDKTERRVKFTFKLICAFFAILISVPSIYFIVLYWGKVEPLISAVGILFSLIVFLFPLYTGYAPDRINIFNTLKEKITDSVFKAKGLSRSELKEKLASLQNHDENKTFFQVK